MNFSFEIARDLMVENQLRPNKINNTDIIDLFRNIKKENFLFDYNMNISYSDSEITLDNNRGYLKNLHIAQLIQHAEIKKSDKILHIGGLTGYVSFLLSSLCKKLISIENNNKLIEKFETNINNDNKTNIKIINSEFKDGYEISSPYDIIFIDNPITDIIDALKNQLNSNLGKIIMIVKSNNFLSKAIKITKNNEYYNVDHLFDVFTKFELYKEKKEFVF